MQHLNKIILIIVMYAPAIWAQTPRYAVCNVPVAEVLGSATPPSQIAAYFKLPCMFHKDAKYPYLRKHQLVFQEVVEVLDEQNNQVLVNLPAVFYETKYIRKPDTTGWVHASQLSFVDGDALAKLPRSLGYQEQNYYRGLEGTASLVEPYYEPTLGMTLSAGTRFRIASVGSEQCEVFCYHPEHDRVCTISIPKHALMVYAQKSEPEQRREFVELIQLWADQNRGPIAYVLGGNSIIKRQLNERPGTITCFGCNGYNWTNNDQPVTGLDCSGMIVRAAQMVGIPFFYKNSITMARYLKDTTSPKLGDIIWIPGHVMVLSDLQQGLLVEARGYAHGYGTVQEIPISEQFQGIHSVDDLVYALQTHKSLKRMNKRGEVVEVYPEFKLLSLIG